MFEFLKSMRKKAVGEVVAVHMVSPNIRAISLGGPEIADFLLAEGIDEPGAWVKVALPTGEKRAYTIRRIDRQAGILDLEFVLHEHNGASGPASNWASKAQLGEKIGIAGPRDGGFHLPADACWIILAGDATALPAMQTIAKVLPSGIKTEIYAEVCSSEDQQIFKSQAVLSVAWLDQESTPGTALRRALVGKLLPAGPGYIWVAGESGAVRALRLHYLQSLRVVPERVCTKGYWKAGEAAHRDA